MGIRISKGGLLTTVQDLGRTGYQSQGFGTSGAMDVRSFKIANLLLENEENEAVLEFALVGPTIEFTTDTIIAITGGDFEGKINDKPITMYQAIYANKGDILEFQGAKTGRYGYIAFSSCLDIPMVMGSRSTNIGSTVGGFKGRILEKGDYIRFRKKRRYIPYFLSHQIEKEEFQGEEATLRVILGPQDDKFTDNGIRNFLNETYKITRDFDRMGCRLEGPFVEYKGTTDIISDGIVFGSVQVPSHGQPIILLSDRQTTGGYAKVATVISVDLPKLVQRNPDHTIKFQEITIQEAQKLVLDEVVQLEEFKKIIQTPCPEVLENRLVAKRLEILLKNTQLY